MREAVERAEAPDEIDCVDPDDGVCGEQLREDAEGDAVLGVIERGDEDAVVGAIEIGVAGGEADAVEMEGGRHGEIDDGELAAVGVGCALKAFAVLGERPVVRIAAV